MLKLAIVGAAAVATLAAAAPAAARDIVVQMKNVGTGGSMVFEPAFIKAQPGDTIHFKPTDPATMRRRSRRSCPPASRRPRVR